MAQTFSAAGQLYPQIFHKVEHCPSWRTFWKLSRATTRSVQLNKKRNSTMYGLNSCNMKVRRKIICKYISYIVVLCAAIWHMKSRFGFRRKCKNGVLRRKVEEYKHHDRGVYAVSVWDWNGKILVGVHSSFLWKTSYQARCKLAESLSKGHVSLKAFR